MKPPKQLLEQAAKIKKTATQLTQIQENTPPLDLKPLVVPKDKTMGKLVKVNTDLLNISQDMLKASQRKFIITICIAISSIIISIVSVGLFIYSIYSQSIQNSKIDTELLKIDASIIETANAKEPIKTSNDIDGRIKK